MKPIIFSTPMVQAILEGRKTQTRRILKRQPDSRGLRTTNVLFEDWHGREAKPLCNEGDILWVRETYGLRIRKYAGGSGEYFVYRASEPNAVYCSTADGKSIPMKWKPSIFMPKVACRIFLKVTNLRVERLQDISEEDAKSEGVIQDVPLDKDFKRSYIYRDYTAERYGCMDARSSFMTLWQSINGKESWNNNPWVWVYEFERTENPTS